MKELLFINACVRGKEVSRTYDIARCYVDKVNASNDYNVIELDLMERNPEYHTYANFSDYQKKIETGMDNPDNFVLAKQFATCDEIVIAAPFWEFSFPAVLSAYIENISVAGITFNYTDKGSVGCCNAKKMVYIATSGDCLSETDKIGEHLLQRLAMLYGILEFKVYYAQGLDLWGADVEQIIKEAKLQF